MRRAVVLAAALGIGGCDCGGGAGAIDGELRVDPPAVDFGRVGVGLASRATLVLANTGQGPVAITSARATENLAAEVRIDAVPAAIAPGARHRALAVFVPAAKGPRDGELVFTTDSAGTPEVRVRVVGAAIDPRLIATPSILELGRVIVGLEATATATLTNAGEEPVRLAAITPDLDTSAEFAVALGSVVMLEPGASVPVTVRYAPADAGLDEGRLVVADDTARPDPLAIVVRGEGIVSDVRVEPQLIRFAGVFVGERRTRAVVLRNVGARAHTVSTLALVAAATTAAELAIDTSTAAPLSIAPGESRRVEVSYAPLDDRPAFAELRVESSGLVEPVLVALRGEPVALPAPEIEVSPATVAFGRVQVGARSRREVRVDNVGTSDLHLSGQVEIRPPGAPFAIAGAPAAGATLAPLDSHTLAVEFAPSAPGPAPVAALVVRSDDPAAPEVEVPLAGEGSGAPSPDLVVSPEALAFGPVPRGVEAARAIDLENLGSAAVSIATLELTGDGRFRLGGAPALPLVLAPGEAARIAVEFADPAGLDGAYAGELRIDSDDPDAGRVSIALAAHTVSPAIVPPALSVSLAWDTPDGDLDLHLIRPGGELFDRPSDCCTCSASPRWGTLDQALDDPFLDRDDLAGFGPETISAAALADGDYAVVVHARGDPLAARVAEVSVRSGGRLLGVYSREIAGGQRWDVGVFSWSGASGAFSRASAPLVEAGRSSCF